MAQRNDTSRSAGYPAQQRARQLRIPVYLPESGRRAAKPAPIAEFKGPYPVICKCMQRCTAAVLKLNMKSRPRACIAPMLAAVNCTLSPASLCSCSSMSGRFARCAGRSTQLAGLDGAILLMYRNSPAGSAATCSSAPCRRTSRTAGTAPGTDCNCSRHASCQRCRRLASHRTSELHRGGWRGCFHISSGCSSRSRLSIQLPRAVAGGRRL